ncbi:hypothetical protein CI266_004669 [Salmonella enterica subsp. enterica serovar Kotte]|nr:hypothetical protein [Salmonella enterica subsp. enterica serovar Kotte]
MSNEWRYSLRRALPVVPCPGEDELISVTVTTGEPVPPEIAADFIPDCGNADCLDFIPIARRGYG